MTFRNTRTAAPLAALLLAAVAAPAAARAQDTTTTAPSVAAPRPLSLGDAARLAARQGAIAEAARYRADEATARVRQARSALLPDVTAAASDGQRTFNTASFGLPLPGFDPNGEVIGPVRTVDFRGRAAMPILDVGAIGRVRAAQSSARSAGAEAANSAEQAAQAASAAYLRALRAEEIVHARTADSALAGDLLRIAEDQLRAGVGVGLDVTRAQAQVAATHAQLIAARNDRDRSRLDLQRAVGLPLESPVILTDSLSGLTLSEQGQLPDEAAAIARAFRTRPDLRAAEEQLRAARQQVSATRAERLPSVGVFADDGITGASYNHLLGTYTYGVQLSLPIFEGFRREGRIEEQSAVARELDVRSRDLRQQAAIEVRGALLDLASTREQVAATRERLRLAEQELAQARDRFRAGVAGNADIISASLALNTSRNLVIDALTAYQNARVSFARATGSVTELP
ncbi:MAG TPA: TolC family protein [Gemmatimonadaceae bacterium]|nr:TolC family protein [Gemmatimonadaceae bacterium]